MYVSTRYGWLSGPVQVCVAHPVDRLRSIAVQDDAALPPVTWPVEEGIVASLE